MSSDVSSDLPIKENANENINVVSTQSSSKPGCVIKLAEINDSNHVCLIPLRL